VALGDLPSIHAPFPDEAHEAIRQYVDQTTVGVDDLAMGMQALAQLAGTFFAALDSSVADRASLHTADTDEATRAKAAEKSLSDRLTALEARTASLEALRLRGTTGSGSVTSLIAGTSTLTVTLKTPMPDATWMPFVWIDATTGLNLASVTATVTARTATTATVRIANAGLGIATTVNFTVLALALS